MNEIQIFNNPEFGSVRTLEENGKVLFCGSDVAKALGYDQPSKAIGRHCRYGTKRPVPHPQSPDKTIEMPFIPESDLYRLVFRSKLPGAEKFTDWVTEEVLPSLRKNGSYSTGQPMTAAELIAAQAQVLVDMERRMDEMQGQARALEDHTKKLEAKVDTAIKAFSHPDKDHWVGDMDQAIKQLCADMKTCVPKMKGKLYAELEEKANCDINRRLSALRRRQKKTGVRYKDAAALTKLDAIAADKKLRAIFEGIVRSWQARVVPAPMEESNYE